MKTSNTIAVGVPAGDSTDRYWAVGRDGWRVYIGRWQVEYWNAEREKWFLYNTAAIELDQWVAGLKVLRLAKEKNPSITFRLFDVVTNEWVLGDLLS